MREEESNAKLCKCHENAKLEERRSLPVSRYGGTVVSSDPMFAGLPGRLRSFPNEVCRSIDSI